MVQVGFVGLGVMGAPMAGHILDAGVPLVVYNRTRSKADDLAQRGAIVADSLAELGARCGLVFLCVNRTEDVRECLGELTRDATAGTLFVDHSTISPRAAVEIHEELKAQGFRFVDAPITGGSMGALIGSLTVFCGGEPRVVEEARPTMAHYSKRIERAGGPGAGQRMKMANQIAVGGALLALCESLAFAQKAGLDLMQTRDLLAGGAAGSWAFENYGPKILARDWSPGFSITNQLKDFGYCEEAASEADAAIPGTLLVSRLLKVMEAEGHGDWATAALFELLAERGFED
jgi:3-hydroxyisobutyrate dehydrogenase-like beta-hydroxyacid dehydrogenase